ncbi:MAG: SH3 domain-containing protein [Sphingobacteriaceae bacterium]|nr:SH3 domain-containing protein [Sphingobacteriaceae bacterium]
MTRKSFLFSIALILFCLNLSAQDLYKVTADKLRVRETNSTDSKIIGFVPQNENVQVLDSTDAKYFKVKVTNGEGWVSSEFLQRVSPAPIQKVQPKVVEVKPAVIKEDSNILFISLVALVLLSMLFLIFKFLMHNKPLMVFAIVCVISIGYLCFSMFLVQKTISGKFTSDSDTQYLSFDFKSKDSVVIQDTYADSLFTAKYIIEGEMIKLKQQENTILLMIRDNQTLIGEGFTKGVYNKN